MWWFFLSSCLVLTHAYIPPQNLFKGDNATLECAGSDNSDVVLLEWLLPTNVVISETIGRFIVGDGINSASLHITELRLEDNGEFRCVYYLTSSSTKKEVNMITLKVRDTYIKELEDWQANVTRGAVSAAVMACFFVSICAIHKYRWRSPEEDRPSARSSITVKRQSQIPRASLQGVDNPALSEESSVVESAM